MNEPILLSYPYLHGNEKKYVVDCLDSEWVSTSGKYVSDFEEAFALYTGAINAVACVNGTAALHICLILAGVQPGEEVIVPALTFISPINTVRYVFAEPVFMDCDDYLNMDTAKLAEFLENECDYIDGKVINKRTGKRIRVIMPVHVFGSMCDMDKLMDIAEKFNLIVIEDATEALGSKMTLEPRGAGNRFAGKHAGTIGEFGACSFNGNKIMTCGGGGMISAKSVEHLKKAKYLTTQAKDDGLHYIHSEVGYNYRLTAISAAMGLAQIENLPEFVKNKQKRYAEYKKEIANIPGLSLLDIPEYCESNCWFYSLVIDKEVYGMDRDQLMNKFESQKIQTRPIWKLNHHQKPYLQNQAYQIEKSQYYFDRVLNIPCSVGLTDEEMERVLAVLRKSVSQ
jgi:perosamine synthetase